MIQNTEEANNQKELQQNNQEEGINPIKSAVEGDIFPLIAALDHLQWDELVDTFTPLSHYICTLYIPLQTLLKTRQLPMNKNIQGRLPLSFAIKTKDALATYYCLQQPHEINTRSVYGLTPAMEALKSGFKIGFLLCVHFGHITNDLANVAAQINDLWALKFLKSLNVPLNQKDFKGVTPLEVAVSNYSYECIDYLAKLYPKDIKMDALGKIVKSKTIFNNLKQIKYGGAAEKSSIFDLSLFKQVGFLILLFFLINSFPKFSQPLYLNFILLMQLAFLILYYNAPDVTKKPEKNILKTIQPFIKTQLPQICPICFQVKRLNFQHCSKCGVCIEGLHFHKQVCVSRCNQVRWIAKEILWLIIFKLILGQYIEISESYGLKSSWRYMETFSILYSESSVLLNDFLLYTACFIFFIKQIFNVILIVYIVVSGRTYQQVLHSERYLNNYEPVLVSGNYFNRPINSENYTFKKGVSRAFSNSVKFFCG